MTYVYPVWAKVLFWVAFISAGFLLVYGSYAVVRDVDHYVDGRMEAANMK